MHRPYSLHRHWSFVNTENRAASREPFRSVALVLALALSTSLGCSGSSTDSGPDSGAGQPGGTCTPTCQVLGQTECSNGSVRRCGADSEGCLKWGAFESCASGTCGDTVSCSGCVHQCNNVGDVKCEGGKLSSCELDSNGCKLLLTEPCSSGACGDAVSCSECVNQCNNVGDVKCEGGKLSSCRSDSNGCKMLLTQVCSSGACQNATACASAAELTAPVFSATHLGNTEGGYLVVLKWDAVSGAAGYEVAMKGPGDTNFRSPDYVSTNSFQVVVELLDSRTGWEFKARAKARTGALGPWSQSWVLTLKETLALKQQIALAVTPKAVAISRDGSIVAVTQGAEVAIYQLDGTSPLLLKTIKFGTKDVQSIGLARSPDGSNLYIYGIVGDEAKLIKFAPDDKEILVWKVGDQSSFIREVDTYESVNKKIHILFLIATSSDLVLWDIVKNGTDQYEEYSHRALREDFSKQYPYGFTASDVDVFRAKDSDQVARTHLVATDGAEVLLARIDAATGTFIKWDAEEASVKASNSSVVAASTEGVVAWDDPGISNNQYGVGINCYSLSGGMFPCLPGTSYQDQPSALYFTPLVMAGGYILGGGDLLVAPYNAPMEFFYLGKTRVVLPSSTAGVLGPEGIAGSLLMDSSGSLLLDSSGRSKLRVVAGAEKSLVILEQSIPKDPVWIY